LFGAGRRVALTLGRLQFAKPLLGIGQFGFQLLLFLQEFAA
jgi:hypothetical protein